MWKKMRITAIVSLFALLASAISVSGQSLYKVLEVGDEAFESRDYYAAFRCYETVLQEEERFYSKDRSKRYLKLQYGLAAQRFNYFERADSVYRSVINQSEADNKMDSVYARAVYHLAQTQLIQAGNDSLSKSEADSLYRQAQATFQQLDANLLQQIHQDADYREQYRLGAEAGLENCAFALENDARLPYDTIYRIPDAQINSRYSDFAPVWEDSTLYFSSLRHPRRERRQSTVYSRNLEAVYGDSTVSVRQLPENEIYNQANRYTNHRAISGNGQWMVFTGCELRKNEIVCALYKRQLLPSGGWGSPMPLALNDPEEDVTYKQPVFMQDCDGQEWLYFSSNREGSKGGLDIWRSSFDAQSGTVGSVENLGDPINTRWQEQSPFFYNLTGELFFSSDRPGGYGQHDLFSSEWENGAWQAPKNAGSPLNSGYNDMYYFTVPDGSKVYFSSDRPQSMRFVDSLNACCQDIYVLERNIDREIQLDLAQCDTKPYGVAGTNITVEDVTICGATTTVLDTTISSSQSTLTLPAKRFRKYQVSVATEGLAEQDSTVLIDLSEDQYGEALTAAVDFAQYPDFLELKLVPDPPRPPAPNEFTEEVIQTFREERIAEPFVRTRQNQLIAAAVPDSNIFRVPYGEAVNVGVEVDTNRNILDLSDNTYYLYSVELENMVFPMQACQKVCRAEVPVPLLAKSQFSANMYFDNDKPERDGYRISVTTKSLEETTSFYLGRQDLYTNPNNFKADSTKQQPDGRADGDDLRSRINTITTKSDAIEAAEDFFQREVENGLGELTDFGRDLLRALDRLPPEQTIEINIRGMCSTHGNSTYNDSLAVRRIQCITEFLQDVELKEEDGSVRRLGDYLDTSELNKLQKRRPKGVGRRIKVVPQPSGEPKGTVRYFDDMLINTRYSVAAASDRKVELSVSITEQEPPDLSVFDLGEGCAPVSEQDDSLSSKNPRQ